MVLLVYAVSTVLEDTGGCANQYMGVLYISLMTMLSPLYGVVVYCVMNAPGHVNDVVDRHNTTDFVHLK